jgi:hypothetical protein
LTILIVKDAAVVSRSLATGWKGSALGVLGRASQSRFAIEARGWVVEIGGCAVGWAHPLEKSGSVFVIQAYISYLIGDLEVSKV